MRVWRVRVGVLRKEPVSPSCKPYGREMVRVFGCRDTGTLVSFLLNFGS